MKNRNSPPFPLITAAVIALLAARVEAQDSSNAPAAASVAPATVAAPAAPSLAYGVTEVLKLSQAKISDSTIVTYVKNSTASYPLDASQIVYLKQQGVADSVITAMLDRKNAPAAPAQSYTAPSTAQTSTAIAPTTVTYVQTAPAPTIQYVPDYYYYRPNYYPYYADPFYGWPYPAVSFSFGYGFGHHGGGHRGGGGRGGGHR